MTKRRGDAAVTIIIVVVVILIILVSYFMFFRNMEDDNAGNLNNQNNENNATNDEVGIYGNDSDMLNDGMDDGAQDDVNDNMTISDANANNFYQRVKSGITLNGNLIEVPAEYMTRLTNKIGEVGYTLTDEASQTVNSKYDEIVRTLTDNNISDINDLDAKTKDRIDTLVQDIENAL